MDIELPETVTVATRVGNRLVLVQSLTACNRKGNAGSVGTSTQASAMGNWR